MWELIINAEIVFSERAREFFNFPISDSIRLSFWLVNDEVSTFSEIRVQNRIIEIGKSGIFELVIVEREFLYNRIGSGVEFKMGTFPVVIAIGRILDVKVLEKG